jgi:hypothetical protein
MKNGFFTATAKDHIIGYLLVNMCPTCQSPQFTNKRFCYVSGGIQLVSSLMSTFPVGQTITGSFLGITAASL